MSASLELNRVGGRVTGTPFPGTTAVARAETGQYSTVPPGRYGNGQVNLTALETAYKEMNVTVEVIKDMKLEWPRIETPDAWITLGIGKDLNVALDLLKAQTTTLLMEQRRVSKEQAEKLMLATWDCRITQVVDVNRGLHCFNVKDARSQRRIEPLPDRENRIYLVTVGRDPDFNKAMDTASWEMIELLRKQKGRRQRPRHSPTASPGDFG
jgi:acetamidase/formamidase